MLKKHIKLHFRTQETQETQNTLESNGTLHKRKRRKDFGSMKVSTAVKLAGYPISNIAEKVTTDCPASEVK